MKGFSNVKVMIVEDEDYNYEYLNEVLLSLNIKTLRAVNGKQAIDKFLTEKGIDLILMDVKMPVLNGYEAAKRIKKIDPDIPVIAQTAFAMIGDDKISYEAGCDDYISKPIRKELLYAKLKKFLSLR